MIVDTSKKQIILKGKVDFQELKELTEKFPDYEIVTYQEEATDIRTNGPFIPWNQPTREPYNTGPVWVPPQYGTGPVWVEPTFFKSHPDSDYKVYPVTLSYTQK